MRIITISWIRIKKKWIILNLKLIKRIQRWKKKFQKRVRSVDNIIIIILWLLYAKIITMKWGSK